MPNKYDELSITPVGQSLKNLLIVEQDARDFGFDWPNLEMIIKQAISESHESHEIHDALVKKESAERVQEEVGDLLHTAISMCVFLGYDLAEILTKIEQKFSHRMAALKTITKQEHGLDNLHGQSMEFMLKIWDKAKIS
jgi:uncharacterized protein YabN with tetrapyrrole methylase and pyrophosphatase domain